MQRRDRSRQGASLVLAGVLLAGASAGAAAQSSPGGGAGSLESDFTVGNATPSRYVSSLQQSLADARRAVIHAGTRYSTQSDDVDITHSEFNVDLYFDAGTHRLSPTVFFVKYEPETGPTLSHRAGGASGVFRFSDSVALNGQVLANSINASDLPSDSMATYDFWLTLWRGDLLRFDFDVKKELFDNPISLRNGVYVEALGASMDIRPRDALLISVRAARGEINDGNEKLSGEIEAFWRFRASPNIDLGLRVSAFEFSELLSSGYFNPEDYQSAEAMFRWRANLTERFVAEFATSGGVEKTTPGGSRPIAKGSLQLAFSITDDWVLDGGVAYFSSRQSNSTGFARTTVKAALHYRLP